jgi:carbon-monoxide dehydrogenase small subunit
MFAVQVDRRDVTTVEGLARGGTLHPIQEAFIRNFALQCGFCTPGFLMAGYSLLERNPAPTEEDIRKDLSSNLCMCTGYMQIVEAVKQAALTLSTPPPGHASQGQATASPGGAREGGRWNKENT